MFEKSPVERSKHQDDTDVCSQALSGVVFKEEQIHTYHSNYHRGRVNSASCKFPHCSVLTGTKGLCNTTCISLLLEEIIHLRVPFLL